MQSSPRNTLCADYYLSRLSILRRGARSHIRLLVALRSQPGLLGQQIYWLCRQILYRRRYTMSSKTFKDCHGTPIEIGAFVVFARTIYGGSPELTFAKVTDIKNRIKLVYRYEPGCHLFTWVDRAKDMLIVEPNMIPADLYRKIKDA